MEWVRGQTIGHGSFARVSLAKPTNQSSRFPPLMAVKSSPMSQSTSLANEFTILNELKHCSEIISSFGDCFTVEKGEKLYNITLEYAASGSLADKVKDSKTSSLPESDVRRYTKSILKGLQFVHRKGFVHCDIKLQNILLFSGDNVKIADFGLAKKADETSDLKYEFRGTPMYMAPETVVDGEQGPPSDIWAVGCLVSEMMTGKPAWDCSGINELMIKIGIGDDIPEIPRILSDAGKDFVGKCFVKDASKRWSADMLLNHPFMVDCEDQNPSNSPRNPFDFPDWESEVGLTETLLCSPESECWIGEETSVSAADRLRRLAVEGPDWDVTSSWITVR